MIIKAILVPENLASDKSAARADYFWGLGLSDFCGAGIECPRRVQKQTEIQERPEP